MRRPTRESIEGLRPISRNLSLDLIAAIGYGVSGALVSSLLPTIARRGGLEPLGLAALSAAPFLTNLLSVFSGRIGPWSTRQFALLRGKRYGLSATVPGPKAAGPPSGTAITIMAPRVATIADMRLTPWEEERLLIFSAAELARRHRDRGLLLSAPEAIALICDAMLDAARAGAGYVDVEAAGRNAVAPDEVMPGVGELVDEVRLEVLMDDGTRLIVLLDPLGRGDRPRDAAGPGAIRPADSGEPDADPHEVPARETLELTVRSESRRAIRVSSHYPFNRVNPRLIFDRESARGFRLDLPAGASERWAPGESRTVRCVRFGGRGGDDEGSP